jgi:endoglycosylceramidase
MFFLGALTGATSPVQASQLIHADGQYFKDSSGRVVMLRGINLGNAAKIPPFQPVTDLSEVKKLHDLGFNNLRLLFIWEAFEPHPGQYDESYLEMMGSIVQKAQNQQMTVVIDFHMDGFSRYTVGGCGSGAPAWTVPPTWLGPAQADNGELCRLWPMIKSFQFVNAFSDFHHALDDFYGDRYGVRTHYLEVLKRIAHYFKQFPAVIGYDMLNEPWGQEITQIGPLYEDSARVIRAEDPSAVLFVEPEVFVALGWNRTMLTKPAFDNFAYAPHDYDAFALGLNVWLDLGLFVDTNLWFIRNVANRWNVPVYIGEFGVAGGGGLLLRALLKHYYGLFDHHFVSSAQWDYSPLWNPQTKDGWSYEDMSIVDNNGMPRRNLVIRPYASAVSGVPTKMNVDLSDNPSERELQFEWDHVPGIGSTDFYLPPAIYTSATQVHFNTENDDLRCAFDPATSTLSCNSDVAGHKSITISGPN